MSAVGKPLPLTPEQQESCRKCSRKEIRVCLYAILTLVEFSRGAEWAAGPELGQCWAGAHLTSSSLGWAGTRQTGTVVMVVGGSQAELGNKMVGSQGHDFLKFCRFYKKTVLASTPVTRVTATDADDPVYGNSAKLVYSILEGQPYFSVDPNSATIKIALHGMDREMREEYLVVIQAKDMGGHMGGLSGTTTVTVTLTDINDNPPKFSKSLYEFVIPEDLPLGKTGGKVKANDRDIGENAKSTYNIIDGDDQGMFEMVTDAQTQEGILRLKKPLDYESKRAFTLKVEATNIRSEPSSNGPFKDTATVKIVVEDSDEPPVFSKPMYFLEVNENAPINTVIGTVTARDPDSTGSLVRYFIDRHTDLERQFNINVDDGKITLAKPLDRETDMWHNITVTATEVRNHSQISRAIVAIRVMDVNDNAPYFADSYETFLCENGKPGQVIQTIKAKDKDDPIQGHYFDFRLVPEMLNNPNFTIKNNPGERKIKH
ncbi:hypothetical protein INR49_001245 [Caranx melampygus]|nr:hypothetical protein INR49_001245 [Caranx melampygus]